MVKLTKKKHKIHEIIKNQFLYPVDNAISILKEVSSKKFNETVEVSINLGVDSRKSDQIVRSATKLPKGTGKVVRLAVFAQGDNAILAKKLGADIIGFEDLADNIKSNQIDFDVLIATPDAMRIVGQLGQILGPKGLMPNPKDGTVTSNLEMTITDIKFGKVRYRTDKNGIIHCAIGKINFNAPDIVENLSALLVDLLKLKPAASKGVFFEKITLSTTMGPGLVLDILSIPM